MYTIVMIDSEKYRKKTDNELVELTLENQSYFLYLIEKYENKLLNYILRISNVSYEEAEDILQDSFIKIYTNLNDFDFNLKFSSWAYRIVHNQVINNYRKIQARPQLSNLPDIDDNMLNNLASDLNLEKEIDFKFLKKNINKILDKMDIKYKEILILKFLEEKNYNEISDILKKSSGTVASLINRAKKNFQQELINQKIKL